MQKQSEVIWQNYVVTQQARTVRNQHKPMAIWLTGLSGAGKSSIANALQQKLFAANCQVYVLDGDNMRHGLCNDLGFNDEDRVENLRRVGEVAKLFVDAGFIVISAFISPFEADREKVRKLFSVNNFIEVYCSADLNTCESRDIKGLYAKARQGLVQHFTGISSPYEAPHHAEVILDTGNTSIDDCVEMLLNYLQQKPVYVEG